MDETCSICSRPATLTADDCLGHTHRACREHEHYLPGWLRDVEHESGCESEAARRYERAAYGWD